MKTNGIAVIFPGQGVQRPGMGRDFFEKFDIARATLEAASRAVDVDMSRICLGDDPRLGMTEFTQPAILTVEIAMFRVMESVYGIRPAAFAGHSLGEYAALTAAGVMQFEDAVRLVRVRGRLMQSAVPAGIGAMAAVIDPESPGLPLLADIVKESGAEMANYNSATQAVISGQKPAVEKAAAAYSLQMPNARVVMLDVSAPFHSSLMKQIETDFRRCLETVPLQTDRAEAVLSNVTGGFHKPKSLVDDLVVQISSPVRWDWNMQTLKEFQLIYEIGPWKVLSAFFAGLTPKVVPVYNTRTMETAAAEALTGADA